jgi:lipoate-protein ligase B
MPNYCQQDTLTSTAKSFFAAYLGVIPYERSINLQTALMQARLNDKIPDFLLLLQHPPVLTIGRFRGKEDILVSREKLRQEGITVFHTNRGGSITYHGPGQLVVYPIISLRENNLGIRDYIQYLEEMVIKTLAIFEIEGRRIIGYPGIWVHNRKICSIGIHVSRYVATHGFALNVNTDLRHFSYINSCGDSRILMTSISNILRRKVDIKMVANEIINSFSTVFISKFKEGFNECKIIADVLNG